MSAQNKNKNLGELINPKSILVTGVSSHPEDLGSYVLRNIIYSGYGGRLFPVNEKLHTLYEFDVYSSIRKINEEVDLAVLVSSPDRIIDEVYDCSTIDVKYMCIISRGFHKLGEQGLKIQKKIRQMAKEAGIEIIGPNSLGFISTSANLNASIAPKFPKKGKTAFLSQSGALINAFIEYSDFYSLGLSEVVGLGNKSDLSEIDFLKYYGNIRSDGRPTVIGAYLENIFDGEEFLKSVPHVAQKIPLVMLIPEKSEVIAKYVYDHSGTIIQKSEVLDAALEQSGVIRTYTQQGLYDTLLAFSWQPLPRGNHVSIISNAGGGLVLGVESLSKHDLKLVNFSTKVRKQLQKKLHWRNAHPGIVDLGGDALAQSYLKSLDTVLGDYDVNAVLVILSHQIMTQIEDTAEAIGRIAKSHGKTVVAAFMGYEDVEKGIRALGKYFIPAYKTVDRAVKALSNLHKYYLWSEKVGGQGITKSFIPKEIGKGRSMKTLEILEYARVGKQASIRTDDCFEILQLNDINTDHINRISSLKDILNLGDEYNFPLKFHCVKEEKSWILNSKKHIKNFFEDHFTKYKIDKEHKIEDHLIRPYFGERKRLKISLYKDTYYGYLSQGWSASDLDRLSFGYILEISMVKGINKKKTRALIPVDTRTILNMLANINFFDQYGLKSGKRKDKLEEETVDLVKKTVNIPMLFDQVLSLEIEAVFSEGKLFVSECSLKPDLIV